MSFQYRLGRAAGRWAAFRRRCSFQYVAGYIAGLAERAFSKGSDGSWTLSAKAIALLWYKPEGRLSVSVWTPFGWRNIRLRGPRKLSFER